MTRETQETTFTDNVYEFGDYNTGDKTPATPLPSVTSVISTKLSNEIKSSDQANQYLSVAMKAYEHFNSVTDQLKAENQQVKAENQQVKAENQQLKAENQQLKAENQQVKAENQQVKEENQKVKEENQQVKAENRKVKAENQQVKAENQKVKAENQQVKAENQQLRAGHETTPTPTWMALPETTSPGWNQRSSYFYKRKKRQTEPCQSGWFHFQDSCYVIWSNTGSSWEEARDDCRGKTADLVVIESPEEQEFISNITRTSLGISSYWIGLRAEAGGWQFVNGSDLTKDVWMKQPADGHRCAIFTQESDGWKAVSCDVKNGWICEKKAD
ncbi:C-type lectin domain family 4 member G-like [Scomber japonicus]|uniref:C-type lectin domain family 4 member G-like n=1 Tax=Scomber japonicus TaxID=13676 RepID=UPI0023051EC0|nr:C-type lectin domain family 4 member G-like [Scomber japonicus]